MAGLKKIELPGLDLSAAKQVAKAALAAVEQGQLGYAVFIAEKPQPGNDFRRNERLLQNCRDTQSGRRAAVFRTSQRHCKPKRRRNPKARKHLMIQSDGRNNSG